jgi:hypothetical protein
VLEVEPPGAGLRKGREQLHRYLRELREAGAGVELHGVVLDGLTAEYWVVESWRSEPVRQRDGRMVDIVRDAVQILCSEKVPVVLPEDLVEIFGV